MWVGPEAKAFDYTDGIQAERYLQEALCSSSDLSSGSYELEQKINDWASEYHLARERVQLLRAFDYGGSKKVLEVGCGCGSITRFLGETFEHVISVEGSHARARLARMRTKDLENVFIVNAPFQDLKFRSQFDIIFCIGVFEYSGLYVQADDPYRETLKYFSKLLAPNGVLVLAIENQFGLKYFCSSAEDHTGVMHDGIEGYPRHAKGPRTFGYAELRSLLEEYFGDIDFYYPFPDYKMPACIVSDQMLSEVDVSEMIGSYRTKDYCEPGRKPLFSEQLAWRAIAKNRMVPWFANSFLVVAGIGPGKEVSAPWLGVAYSNRRRKEFSTITHYLKGTGGAVRVVKSRVAGGKSHSENCLEHRQWEGEWIDGESLQLSVARRARERDLTIQEIIEPSLVWFQELKSSSTNMHGRMCVSGNALDSIWRNCFVKEGQVRYIDQEWAWKEELPLEIVVIRGLYYFATGLLDSSGLNRNLQGIKVSRFITSAARLYGLRISRSDLLEFIRFESQFLRSAAAGGKGTLRERIFAMLDVHLVLRKKLEPAPSRGIIRLMRKWLSKMKRSLLPARQ